MIEDIWLVARRELLETLTNPKTRRQNMIAIGATIAVVDLVPPFMIRDYWASIGIAFGLSFVGLVMTPLMTTADSIAGERERHTLETLLATRLPDRAIAFGKILALVLLSLSTAAFTLLQALIVISIVFGNWAPFGLILLNVLGVLVAGVVVSVFLCSIGVLVSMRAQTVQSAQQALAFVLVPIFMMPAAAVPLLGPARILDLLAALARFPPILIGLLVVLLAVAVDALLLAWIGRAFRRHRVMGA